MVAFCSDMENKSVSVSFRLVDWLGWLVGQAGQVCRKAGPCQVDQEPMDSVLGSLTSLS